MLAREIVDAVGGFQSHAVAFIEFPRTGRTQYLPSILPIIRESIRELDVPEPTVLVEAGACRIGSGVRTIIMRVAPLERFGPATPATPLVPRPPPPASAAGPQARVAMINVVAGSRNVIFGNPMPRPLSTSQN